LDGLVRVWDSDSGALKRSLEGPSDVEWLSWHSKGNVLLCGSSDGTVWMWLATTGACMQVFAGHEGAVTCGLFSPDGRAVVTGGADATVRLWAPKKGTCKHVFQGHGFHDGGVTCLAAHPLFDATGAAAETSGDSSGATGGAAEHSLVVSGAEDGLVKLMHVGAKKVVASFDHSAGAKDGGSSGGSASGGGEAFSVEAVGLCGPQPWLASAGIDGTAKVWDVATGRLRQTLHHPRSGAVTKLAWHPHSAGLLVTAAGDGVVRCWDARCGGAPVAELKGHTDMVVDLAACFGPGPRGSSSTAEAAFAWPDLLLTACDDRTAKVWAVPSL
jgi:ribosome assembly protein SQT1